jgi:hypothetical protein
MRLPQVGAATEPRGSKTSKLRARRQPRALAEAERRQILDVLHSGRFAEAAPAEVCATLLDEGTYLG